MRKVETSRNWRIQDARSITEMGREMKKLFLETLPTKNKLEPIYKFGEAWAYVKNNLEGKTPDEFFVKFGITCAKAYADRCAKAYADRADFSAAHNWYQSSEGKGAGWQVRQQGGVDYAVSVVLEYKKFRYGKTPTKFKKPQTAKTLKVERKEWEQLAYRLAARLHVLGEEINEPLISYANLLMLTGNASQRAKHGEDAMFEQPIEDDEDTEEMGNE
jgi:hypothetical protein